MALALELDEEALAKSEYVKGGNQRWLDKPEESMYVVQGCHIVLCFISCFAACVYLQFVLIPMGMAYFITFLLAPIMDAMEDRPYQFGTKFYCKDNFLHPARKRYQKTARGELLDTVMLGKVPHMLAVLICFVVVGVFFSSLIGTISGSFADFSAVQDEKLEAGGKPMSVQLNDMLNEQIDNLEASGILLKREFVCYAPDGTEMIMRTIPTDEQGLSYLRLYIYDNWLNHKGGADQPAVLDGSDETNTAFNCSRKKIFGTSEGTTVDEIMGYIGMFGGFVSDMIGIALLAIYILLERQAGATVQGDHIVAEQIELMFKTYISMKTALSAVTGVLTAIIMVACNAPLGAVFGLLAFLLNYIPNVGSIIAMVLPVPIIILDEEMAFTTKLIALLGPASVQGYIGNVAEPMMMGEALNLTAISILVGLVFFSFVFGIYGAVLSVPIQAAAKILLHHTDHPLAKGCLTLMREDKTLDYENDRIFIETKQDRKKLTDIDSVELEGTEFEIKTDA
jgi:predicted PurR-regulated permease PerM